MLRHANTPLAVAQVAWSATHISKHNGCLDPATAADCTLLARSLKRSSGRPPVQRIAPPIRCPVRNSAGARSAAWFASALAAMGPNDKFDLLIKGGEVLDPSQNLRAKRDIGIRYGLIEALEADIPADKALTRALSASGKLVTPGLIDLHAHVFPYGSAIGIPADELRALPGHDHAGFRRRCRRQQLRRLPPRHRRPDPRPRSMPSCTSPTSALPVPCP